MRVAILAGKESLMIYGTTEGFNDQICLFSTGIYNMTQHKVSPRVPQNSWRLEIKKVRYVCTGYCSYYS